MCATCITAERNIVMDTHFLTLQQAHARFVKLVILPRGTYTVPLVLQNLRHLLQVTLNLQRYHFEYGCVVARWRSFLAHELGMSSGKDIRTVSLREML